MVEAIIIAVMIMGGLGAGIGVILAAASKIFYVYVDPKILAVEDVLPGANCGGCGLPGCSSNAEAVVAGKASPNSCVAAGPEVAEAIAAIMGVSIEAKEPDIALPDCTYGVKDAATKFIYDGLGDCRAAVLISGGMKVCSIGCLGLGTCAKACPFDAIFMGPEGLPVVDDAKCTGCGTCERVCPKNIIKLSSVTRRILLEYTRDDCTTPCQRACPAGINIREYIRRIGLGEYSRAVQIIKERNPFPTVIGRICPRPCELECRRKYADESVAINFLKRFAADYEKDRGERILPYKAPESGRKVAVVGAGVEGLSTAFFAARLGHETTVFEAASKMGGLLRTAISRYRLPQEILDWDIEGILEMGVNAETEKAMGRDFTISSLLKQGYDTIFLATGGWDSRLARGLLTRGEEAIPGTGLLLDVLKTGAENKNNLVFTSDTVILGGGKLAVDAARIILANGAESVTILLREPESDSINADELKAEGIRVFFNAVVTRLEGEEDRLTQLEVEHLDTEEKTVIQAKNLVLSSGRFPELIFRQLRADEEVSEESETEPEGPVKWEGFSPYKQPAFPTEVGFFSTADELTDFSAAIKAIGAGRRAAASIHQAMYDIDVYLPDNVLTENAVVQDVDHLDNVNPVPRLIMPLADENEAMTIGEIEKGFDEETARQESDRCLKCGLVCYQQSTTRIMEKVAS